MEKVEIYKTPDNRTEVEVHFEGDTVWLTQGQMAELFGQSKQNISLHINNCFKEKELRRSSVVKNSLTTAADGKRYRTNFYNLDVIISVGYRVKSRRGTQFRQWATQRLKEFLVEGIAINRRRLAQKDKEIRVLHDGIRIMSRALEQEISGEAHAWLRQFSMGLKLLDDFDHETLDTSGKHHHEARYPDLTEYMALIDQMKKEFSSVVFGKLKDGSFESAVRQIRQGFSHQDVYPTVEEKAAMLLYLIVKNHAFADGNKRIAAACFLLFLERNQLLYDAHGTPTISNEALAALTLFVAMSKSDEMETVKKVIISILNRKH